LKQVRAWHGRFHSNKFRARTTIPIRAFSNQVKSPDDPENAEKQKSGAVDPAASNHPLWQHIFSI
jgi:hypothetical protein